MHRGFQKVASQLASDTDQDIGAILKQVSMTLISTIGGASGPLYGTFFLRASTTAVGKQELTATDLLAMLKAGVDGIIQRGKANPGDKTMLDAWLPAIATLEQSLQHNHSLIEALAQATAAAEQGVQATIPMIAKKGRASYLGERSAGHPDPGATSSHLMLKALLDTLSST
jgi:dihydroxyacetone kinase-like protein